MMRVRRTCKVSNDDKVLNRIYSGKGIVLAIVKEVD